MHACVRAYLRSCVRAYLKKKHKVGSIRATIHLKAIILTKAGISLMAKGRIVA